MKNRKRIVIKVGSSTLTHKTGLVDIRHLKQLVEVLSDIKNTGIEIVFVSSGAVAVGMGKLGLKERPSDMPSKQAVAAVGQCELMHLYDSLFSTYNHTVAQILLTRDVFERPNRRTHAHNTFCRLLDFSALPIVNENDTVSVEEVDFGDNDQLAAMVSVLIDADALIILSDIDGLYSQNPCIYHDAVLLPCVKEITDEIRQNAGGCGSARGTGGMITKLIAAEMVTKEGIDMHIINGARPENLYDLLDGKPVGTFFPAQNKNL